MGDARDIQAVKCCSNYPPKFFFCGNHSQRFEQVEDIAKNGNRCGFVVET